MFDRAVQASEALRHAAQQAAVLLMPARSRCRACNTVQMIAAPMLGVCQHCGAELVVLDDHESRDVESPWRNAA